MQYPWAVLGAPVICVKSTPWQRYRGLPDRPGQQFPQFMQQYTIRGVTTIGNGRYPALLLTEFKGRWSINCFRPLETLTSETEVKAKEPVE